MDWDLQIHFRKESKDSYCLEAILPNGHREEFRLKYSQEDMSKEKKDLARLFEVAWRRQYFEQPSNMTKEWSYNQAGKLMQELLGEGLTKLERLFKPHVRTRLQNILRGVKRNKQNTLPVIELHYVRDFFLPFEILPLMSPLPTSAPPQNAQEVEDMAVMLFPAANFLIKRIPGPPSSPTSKTANAATHTESRPQKPQMQNYSCREEGADLVDKLNFWLRGVGDIAENKIPAPPLDRMLASLTDKEIDIVHILCHHGIQDNDAFLQFNMPCCGAKPFSMPLSEMTDLLLPWSDGYEKTLPLVFLHACYAGRMVEPHGSFATLLYESGSRAVITSETSVLVSHAVEFAAAFYELHCQRGMQAGEAFHEAKMKCLRGFSTSFGTDKKRPEASLCNPAGLLYTYHGDLNIVGYRPEKKL